MSLLHFILNCTCLLLWINWRSQGLAAVPRAPGIALVGTLKRAESRSKDRWPSWVVLLAFLFFRPIVYRQVGPAFDWTPGLSFGAIVVHFRSDHFGRMFVFSLLAFLVFLAGFYFSLFLLAAVNRNDANHPWQALVRGHLGPWARLPAPALLLLPFVLAGLLWLAVGPLLTFMEVQVTAISFLHLVEQAALIGIAAYLLWQFVIVGVLGLHIVSSYVYLGNAPLWKFIAGTAQNLARPLAWLPLRAGKVDFTPAVALLFVLLLAAWLTGRFDAPDRGLWAAPLQRLYAQLPL